MQYSNHHIYKSAISEMARVETYKSRPPVNLIAKVSFAFEFVKLLIAKMYSVLYNSTVCYPYETGE